MGAHKTKRIILAIFIIFFILCISTLLIIIYISSLNQDVPGNSIGNLNNYGMVCEYKGYIYYVNASDENKLYKTTLDGRINKKLTNYPVANLCAVNDYIYFLNTKNQNNIYKISTSGGKGKKIIGMACGSFNITDDYIYFVNKQRDNYLYRAKLNGKNMEEVLDIPDISPACIVDGYIYSPNRDKRNYIYKFDIESGDATQLTNSICYSCTVFNNTLYYIDLEDNYSLKRSTLDGTYSFSLSTDKIVAYNIVDNVIYYQSESPDKEGIYCMGLQGENVCLLYSGNFSGISLVTSAICSNRMFDNKFSIIPIISH